MKKTLFFGLIAAALGFTACSSEDDAILGEKTQTKGMVLNAIVEQPAETRATIDNSAGTWQFAFAQNDEIKVTNSALSGTYYTFTSDGTTFSCSDATPTATDANWYAYFPSETVDLKAQEGTMASVANLYALAGTTASATTGASGLNITMYAKVAILKIENYKGAIDIQVKTSANDYVTGLTAKNDEAGFDVSTSTTATSLFSTTTKGTFYVAVPAGVKMAVKDGNDVLKSTKTDGLTAGKYYNLTITGPKTGTAKATINGSEVDVNWVQLWAGGPKFAEYNVGVTDGKAESYGGYYCWGSSIDQDSDGVFKNGTDALTGDDDTAYNLWGSAWRMPKQEELEALCNESNCTITWETVNGVNGRKFTGKGDFASNSVFLPAVGGFYDGAANGQGYSGIYWSSTPIDIFYACYLDFGSGGQNVNSEGNRFDGYSVRAVLAE